MPPTLTPGDPPPTNIVRDVRKMMEDLHKPQVISVHDEAPSVLLLPAGITPHSVEAYLAPFRTNPRRRKGTATLIDVASFVTHVNRFKDAHSAIFASGVPDKPQMLCVLNYHCPGGDGTEGATPRFGDHRALHSFPLSEPWNAWAKVDGETLNHATFAELVEDRIQDIIVPPDASAKAHTDSDKQLLELLAVLGGKLAGPTRMMELSRGLKVNENSRFKSALNLSTGETQFQFESEHQDTDGQPLKVPTMFLIAVPVFEGGPVYRVPVRLRYRLNSGKLNWSVLRYRPELSLRHALNEALQLVSTETGLPVLMGAPEG
jgi:uncharacterized protein YfdQ (DUF2303 family)